MRYFTPDPPENWHLNVKKLPKTWHCFKKNCQNISIAKTYQLPKHIKLQFSRGSGVKYRTTTDQSHFIEKVIYQFNRNFEHYSQLWKWTEIQDKFPKTYRKSNKENHWKNKQDWKLIFVQILEKNVNLWTFDLTCVYWQLKAKADHSLLFALCLSDCMTSQFDKYKITWSTTTGIKTNWWCKIWGIMQSNRSPIE